MPQDVVTVDDGTADSGTIARSSILASTGKYDLATVYKLTWCHKDVQSMQGLEGLVNLVELDLSGNRISYISGLQNCKHLQKLVLAKNRITAVDSCLVALTQLEHLLLQGNPILNIESLNLQQISKLTRLSTLYLKNVNGTEACPCCHTKDYKRSVLMALPKLRNLDGERNPLSSSCYSNLLEPASAVHEQMKNFQPDFSFAAPKPWIQPCDLNVPDVPRIKHCDTVRALCGRLEHKADALIQELNEVSAIVQHNIRMNRVTYV